jgi:gas vesicle protein
MVRNDGHQGAFIFGAVVGAIAGAAAALFMTPRSGEQVRQQLAARGADLQGRVSGAAGEMRSQSQTLAGPYVEKVAGVAHKGKEVGASVAQTATAQVQKVTGSSSTESDIAQPVVFEVEITGSDDVSTQAGTTPAVAETRSDTIP